MAARNRERTIKISVTIDPSDLTENLDDDIEVSIKIPSAVFRRAERRRTTTRMSRGRVSGSIFTGWSPETSPERETRRKNTRSTTSLRATKKASSRGRSYSVVDPDSDSELSVDSHDVSLMSFSRDSSESAEELSDLITEDDLSDSEDLPEVPKRKSRSSRTEKVEKEKPKKKKISRKAKTSKDKKRKIPKDEGPLRITQEVIDNLPMPRPKDPYRIWIRYYLLTMGGRTKSLSRQALTRIINANRANTSTHAINRAIRTGVESGILSQPKGTSGRVRYASQILA